MKTIWKKGIGKLGVLQPLLGNWRAEADSPMGKLVCMRNFRSIIIGRFKLKGLRNG